jgi:hypothetical protein
MTSFIFIYDENVRNIYKKNLRSVHFKTMKIITIQINIQYKKLCL